ncbi:MAG TPA: polymer-forming cytoskeletal protein [Stellaceae bacterium]|nr:polymer-forming cytoskeletal protein [Stellaceae bacterium]
MANLLGNIRRPTPPEPLTTVPPPTTAASEAARAGAAEPGAWSVSRAGPTGTATRTLVVGREIVLSGEISACDRLVVEGTVKANIKDCRDIAIAEGGLFAGSAVVETAEIRGRFEGELTVKGRLLVCAPGQVSAKVKYAEIEIERGGRLTGTVTCDEAITTERVTAD